MEMFISKNGLIAAAKVTIAKHNIPANARFVGRQVRTVAKGSKVASQGWQGWFDVAGKRINVEV